MDLLVNKQIKNKIFEEAQKSYKSIKVLSAYCKMNALIFLENSLISKDIDDKIIVVRLQLADIISGATDIEIYDYCRQNGWKLYFCHDLHAKVYLFDDDICLLGSSNLTNKGLNLIEKSNCEMATVFDICSEDVLKINEVIHNATEIDDMIYDKMKACIEEANNLPEIDKSKIEWPKEIRDLYCAESTTLFTADLPCALFNNFLPHNNFDFLGIAEIADKSAMKNVFTKSKAYKWLVKQLLDNEEGTSYFGELTANLHNDIFNDPKPYRKEVKELLNYLLDWVKELEIDEIEIDVPNHSTRVRITNYTRIR